MSKGSPFDIVDFVASATRWAEAQDLRRQGAEGESIPDDPVSPVSAGWISAVWASIKFILVAAATPIWVPAIAWRAAINHRRARLLTLAHPELVRDIGAGHTPQPPGNRVAWVDSDLRMFLSSDLHRCMSGRTDWPKRQGTKVLYDAMLDHYAAGEWHLCENGDIEDFWQVGGSTYGSLYDLLRVIGGLLETLDRPKLLTTLYRSHLDRVVANNRGTYERIATKFAHHGRYHRTVGNHDAPMGRTSVGARLRDHLGGVRVVDHIALVDHGGRMRALITHGHHTDGWNAPERDGLGRLSAWLANTLIDVPLLNTPEGLPPENTSDVLLSNAPNRLISVNPTFGATSTYDSMDEELLFEALGNTVDDMWLMLGHTHVPVYEPLSRAGRPWRRYANSGCGITRELITGLEWDGTGSEPVVRLVAWTYADDETPPGAIVTRDVNGRDVARFVLAPDELGRLRPFPPRLLPQAGGLDGTQLNPV